MLPQGAELQWSTGDMWNTIVELPAGAVIEYKYVLLDSSGQVRTPYKLATAYVQMFFSLLPSSICRAHVLLTHWQSYCRR